METRRPLFSPALFWAIEPSHEGSITRVDGIVDITRSPPYVGDVLTLPFMLDPATGLPCPVRVTRIEHREHDGRSIVIPVVVRAHTS